MNDFDFILHGMVMQRGSEDIVKLILSADAFLAGRVIDSMDKEIEFNASREAYNCSQRNKRGK